MRLDNFTAITHSLYYARLARTYDLLQKAIKTASQEYSQFYSYGRVASLNGFLPPRCFCRHITASVLLAQRNVLRVSNGYPLPGTAGRNAYGNGRISITRKDKFGAGEGVWHRPKARAQDARHGRKEATTGMASDVGAFDNENSLPLSDATQ
jgi:hypothetical protein